MAGSIDCEWRHNRPAKELRRSWNETGKLRHSKEAVYIIELKSHTQDSARCILRKYLRPETCI